MTELVPGGNLLLPGGTLTLQVPGPFDLSALVTDDDGRTRGDGDFVFYNQPSAPGARLRGDTLTVDPGALRPGASRVTLVVSPVEPDTPLERLPAPTLRVLGPAREQVARFTPSRPGRETVLLLAEVYRRGGAWKLRALGQGYADGLAGVARDFGIEVADEPVPAASAPLSPSSPTPAPSPGAHADGIADGFVSLVNSLRTGVGAPPVAMDPCLTAAALEHVENMAAQGRLSVDGPDGTSVFQRITARGYAYLSVGEHLVSGPRTTAEFVEYCLSSEEARRTLHTRAYSRTGLAHVTDPRTGDIYWTALWAEPFTPHGLSRTVTEVVALTNDQRALAGLPPLLADPRLTVAAQAHSTDMVARSFYSHTSPDGRAPWHRAAAAGCAQRSIGENIACGQRSPGEVVQGWMNSPGHRANILKPAFTHIGIGFAGGGRAGTYWTQLFGG